jgi:hypothetical protein
MARRILPWSRSRSESEACRPFGPIDDSSPSVVAVVRLRVVDRAGWELDDEDQEDDQVDDDADLVQPHDYFVTSMVSAPSTMRRASRTR